MKPKSEKISKAKKKVSNILKPSISATTIRRTLRNVLEKDLLTKASGAARNVKSNRRTADVQGKSVKAESSQRAVKNKLHVPNDHTALGGNQNPGEAETSKRQKTSLLEIPKLPTIQGNVFVVGANDVGQLGLKDVPEKTRPAELHLDVPIVDIAAGGMHSVCLTANGEVYTFGCNDEGALGRPQTDDDSESPPAIVNLPETIVMISAGDSHTAALSETGKVYLWGNFRNSQGSMGLTPEGVKQVAAIRILENVQVVKIASGAEHLVCLSTDGDVYTCGCAESGQLGRITPRSASDGGRTGGLVALLKPDIIRVVGRRKKFDNIWTGSYSTFVREKNSDRIYAFGLNNHCHLGYNNRNSEIARYAPIHVTSFPNRTEIISGGQHHTLSLDATGHVYAVGRREYGRLGLGESCDDAKEPTLIPSLQNEECCDISCGNCVSFAINTNGNIYSWGMGGYQLGHGNEEDCCVPTIIHGKLMSLHAFRVAGGGQHTLILAHKKG